jgi:NhaP-type Na+/H+ or K+/H+ antiporter
MTTPSPSSSNVTNLNSNSTNLTDPPYQFQDLMMYLCTTGIIGATIQGIAPKKLLKNCPQPVVILIFYLIGGVIFKSINPQQVDEAIHDLVDPNAIQALFLPVLMFSELFRMNTRAFYIVLKQLLLLIGPGVLYGAALTGVFSYAIMPSRPLFSWNLSMAFGGMLATTDPIAIVRGILIQTVCKLRDNHRLTFPPNFRLFA